MSKQNNGGPAFPGRTMTGLAQGMTLRDYFAAKALQGLLSCPALAVNSAEEIVENAFRYADAMLERSQS